MNQTDDENVYHPAMDISKWVFNARKYAGLTQEQLGEALNVTKGNISGWENQKHDPSWSTILKISEITGYDVPVETSHVHNLLEKHLKEVSELTKKTENLLESNETGLIAGYLHDLSKYNRWLVAEKVEEYEVTKAWPFTSITKRQYESLPDPRKEEINRYLNFIYQEWEKEKREKSK